MHLALFTGYNVPGIVFKPSNQLILEGITNVVWVSCPDDTVDQSLA